MASSCSLTDATVPLLPQHSPPQPRSESVVIAEREIHITSPPRGLCNSEQPKPSASSGSRRLASLDVFRGLTVALMILVDGAGGAFPCVNHSPWFGITLPDVVMPFFLFIVGLSAGLVFKNVSNKAAATQKVVVRFIKLFLLGLLLQGGYFHGLNNLTYGVDIRHIRWLGVLQRISIGYLVVSLAEIWLVGDMTVDSLKAFVKKHCTQWILMVLLSLMHASLLYGLYVPNWEFEIMNTDSASNLNSTTQNQTVRCGLRGSLGPPCNAVGFIDRLILGENHLYQHPVYRRTEECSVNSPDYGPLPPNSPRWCLAPFDPEGILSSFMAIVTCFIGLHYAHIIVNFKSNRKRTVLWISSSIILLAFGCILYVSGMPLSKPLYTLNYMCITTALGGFLLTMIYLIVDVKNIRWPTLLLQWMGMNALLVYALAACDLFAAALQGFYWRSPQNNLVNATEMLLETLLHSSRWGKLVFVLVEILLWCMISALLHMKGIYWKM
ncbi:unnamed protein product [Victoria cruziana]